MVNGLCKSCDAARRYREDGKLRERRAAEGRAFRERHPDYYSERAKREGEKYAARRAVARALKAGTLVRQPCDCGEIAEAHHEDYSRPLDVVWLCAGHHATLHRLRRAKQ